MCCKIHLLKSTKDERERKEIDPVSLSNEYLLYLRSILFKSNFRGLSTGR